LCYLARNPLYGELPAYSRNQRRNDAGGMEGELFGGLSRHGFRSYAGFGRPAGGRPRSRRYATRDA